MGVTTNGGEREFVGLGDPASTPGLIPPAAETPVNGRGFTFSQQQQDGRGVGFPQQQQDGLDIDFRDRNRTGVGSAFQNSSKTVDSQRCLQEKKARPTMTVDQLIFVGFRGYAMALQRDTGALAVVFRGSFTILSAQR